MIGLMFLGAAILWLVLTVCLVVKIPRWCGMTRYTWLLRAVLVPLLLVGPFLDEIVGMRQFEALCAERAVVTVSPNADQVKRAKRVYSKYRNVPGYWIAITEQKVDYIDLDSGIPFLSFEAFFTKGGRIAGIALMGGEHSCSPKDTSQLKRLKTEQLLEQGHQAGSQARGQVSHLSLAPDRSPQHRESIG